MLPEKHLMKLEYLQDTLIESRGVRVIILRPAWLTNCVFLLCTGGLHAEPHGTFFAWITGFPVPVMQRRTGRCCKLQSNRCSQLVMFVSW